MNHLFESYSLAIQMVGYLPNTLSVTLKKDGVVKTNEKPKIIPGKKYYAYALTNLFLRDVSNYETQAEISFEEVGSDEEKEILKSAKSIKEKLSFIFQDEI